MHELPGPVAHAPGCWASVHYRAEDTTVVEITEGANSAPLPVRRGFLLAARRAEILPLDAARVLLPPA